MKERRPCARTAHASRRAAAWGNSTGYARNMTSSSNAMITALTEDGIIQERGIGYEEG